MKNSVMVFILLASIQGFAMQAPTYGTAIEYGAGNGLNTAYVAVDFDGGNAFVFQYCWDGQATAWDALQALAAESDLTVYSDYWEGWGYFVSGFAYPDGIKHDYGTANTGWAYYLSDNGSIWQGSSVGVNDRLLSNGGWDSWVWSNYPADWSMPIRQPGETAVPEPATLILVAFGSVMAAKKKAKI